MGKRTIKDGIVQLNDKVTDVIGDTAGMTDEEFGKARVGIGGSAVSSILGYSPFVSATEEYCRQIKKPMKAPVSGEEEKRKTITFASGHLLEDTVAQMAKLYFKFYKNTEIEMINDTRMFRSKKYPWATANLDRWGVITHDDGSKEVVLIEIKTTSLRSPSINDDWKKGIVPPYYDVQVRHYMAVLDIDHAYICCAWGMKVDDESMAVIRIDRDLEVEKRIMQAESDFWDCVQMQIPPVVPDDDERPALLSKFYARLYGEPDRSLPGIQFSSAQADVAEDLTIVDQRIKEQKKKLDALEKQRAAICNELLPCFIDPKTGDSIASYGSYYDPEDERMITISLDIKKSGGGIDTERLKKEAPDVATEVGQLKINVGDLKKYDKLHDTHYERDFRSEKVVAEDPEYKWSIKVKDHFILS